MGIDDEYTAFCFDEACQYIQIMLTNKKVPIWESDKKDAKRNNKELIEAIKYNNNKFMGR